MNDEQMITRGEMEEAANEPANPNTESNPETERLRTENEKLTRSLQIAAARQEIVKTLSIARAASPELLFEAVKEHLQFAEDGTLLNAAALTAHLAQQFPEQFTPAQTIQSINGGTATGNTLPYLTKDVLANMTPAQIKELDWQEVRRVLSGH